MSNAFAFTVPGGTVTLVPYMLNLLVGDTHTNRGVERGRKVRHGADLGIERSHDGEPVER